MKTQIKAHRIKTCSITYLAPFSAVVDVNMAFKIEQHGEEYTVTVNIHGAIVVVTCPADRLRDVLAMVCE